MRGVHALIVCLLAGLALSGCMHSNAPVATAPPQSDLDAMAYGQPYRSDPAGRPSVAIGGGGFRWRHQRAPFKLCGFAAGYLRAGTGRLCRADASGP